MLWRFFQSAIITAVAGWLLASGATKNGLAAGVVGCAVALAVTIAFGRAGSLGWIKTHESRSLLGSRLRRLR